MMKARIADFDRVTAGEQSQRLGQLLQLGHRRSTHQHRNDLHPAFQRGAYFYAHKVLGILQSMFSLRVGCGEPLTANEDDQRAE